MAKIKDEYYFGLFKTGQLVRAAGIGRAVVLCECKDGYYCVSRKVEEEDGKIYIWSLHGSKLQPYTDTCWNCGKTLISSKENTCSKCHWLICSDCGKCRQPDCVDDHMEIGIPPKINYQK